MVGDFFEFDGTRYNIVTVEAGSIEYQPSAGGNIPVNTQLLIRRPTDTGITELQGTVRGTDSSNTNLGDSPLGAGPTQRLLLQAYADADYMNVYVEHVNRLSQDFIWPISVSETGVDGTFVQLGIPAIGGRQQRLTAVTNEDRDGDGMVANISDRFDVDINGSTVPIDAILFFANPDGITAGQVQLALRDDFTRVQDNVGVLNSNVVAASVKPAAVQTATGGNLPLNE